MILLNIVFYWVHHATAWTNVDSLVLFFLHSSDDKFMVNAQDIYHLFKFVKD